MHGIALDVGASAHDDAAASGFVGAAHALHTHDEAARGEVGRLDVGHEAVDINVGVVNIGNATVDHFGQVVRGHVGGHADGNTAGTVDQEVGDACGHHRGLHQRVVKVGHHVHRFLVEVLHHGFAGQTEACFSVTHGGGAVAVHRTEVALPFHERIAHVPILSHAHQSAIYRNVAVGGILTEYVTDDTGRLAGGFVVCVVQTEHTVKDASVDGLEAVAYIGKSASHDDRHGVVDIRGLHFLLDVHFNDFVF